MLSMTCTLKLLWTEETNHHFLSYLAAHITHVSAEVSWLESQKRFIAKDALVNPCLVLANVDTGMFFNIYIIVCVHIYIHI